MYYQLLVFRPREVPHVLVMSRQCGSVIVTSAFGQMLGDKKTIITAPVTQVTVSQYCSQCQLVTTVRVVTSVKQPSLTYAVTNNNYASSFILDRIVEKVC